MLLPAINLNFLTISGSIDCWFREAGILFEVFEVFDLGFSDCKTSELFNFLLFFFVLDFFFASSFFFLTLSFSSFAFLSF